MSPRGDTEGGGHLQEHHGHQWDQQDQGDQLHPGIKGGKQRKNGIRAVVRRWHREPGHGCPRGMSPPCHQEHQQGQGGRWDRSGLGDRPCQERHQHLWDRGHPEEGGTQGGLRGQDSPLSALGHSRFFILPGTGWIPFLLFLLLLTRAGIVPKGWGQR